MALSANRLVDTKQGTSGADIGYYINIPVGALEEIYQGSFVGLDGGDQFGAAAAQGETFVGLSMERVTGGAANGDVTCKVLVGGVVEHAITSIAQTNIGNDCYFSDDETLTLAATSNVVCGYIVNVPVTGTAIVQLNTPGEVNARA